jgi:hypothetical protein
MNKCSEVFVREIEEDFGRKSKDVLFNLEGCELGIC